jgi:hypothetical protein
VVANLRKSDNYQPTNINGGGYVRQNSSTLADILGPEALQQTQYLMLNKAKSLDKNSLRKTKELRKSLVQMGFANSQG